MKYSLIVVNPLMKEYKIKETRKKKGLEHFQGKETREKREKPVRF